MDFEGAARRFAKDQQKHRSRKVVQMSTKAKKQAEYAQLKQKRLAEERAKEARRKEHQLAYFRQCNRTLGLATLTSTESSLTATSIHGDGDKIALAPSVLEHLSTNHDMGDGSSPWTFRIAIRNPNYTFPASDAVKNLPVPDSEDSDSNDDSSDDEDGPHTIAFLEELSHQYLSYTQGSVVEFTQEEGHIGIPASIAAALINDNVPVTRTKDPAALKVDEADDDDATMGDAKTKTPGHLAWGAFDIPDLPIEVSLVKLPKGKGCTLVPTIEAVKSGFYNLQDVKLVLEQSLIRTRATLSVGDLVHTWHRGIKFDLTVKDVTPPAFNAIVCINTDIEVEFGPVEDMPEPVDEKVSAAESKSTPALSTGRRLGDVSPSNVESKCIRYGGALPPTVELPPEPPSDQTDGVCHVQIRADGAQGRRRFDVRSSTIQQLFSLATTLTGPEVRFRLVTRFPRREFDSSQLSLTLEQAGIGTGQELFLVEKL